MWYSFNALVSYARVIDKKEPFWASEVGLCGGQIAGLSRLGLIEPTGKTRQQFVRLHDNFGFMAETKQWRAVPMFPDEDKNEYLFNYIKRDLRRFHKDAYAIVKMFEKHPELVTVEEE